MKTNLIYQKIPFFSSFTNATLDCIQKVSYEWTFPPGKGILLESEEATAAYIVLEGEVKIFRVAPDGRQQVLTRLFPGEVFNIVPLVQDQSRNQSSAEAVGNTRLLCLPKEGFHNLMNTCPEFSNAIVKIFANRLQKLTAMVEYLSLHSVRGRLAQFLISQADKGSSAPKYTQDEIAQEIGTVRDVVGRLLKVFTDEGYIRREGRKVILLDRAGLEAEVDS
ncbi:MAG: Crp/Fnr family transcriptional regulator [Anaerolineaceae bacterium]